MKRRIPNRVREAPGENPEARTRKGRQNRKRQHHKGGKRRTQEANTELPITPERLGRIPEAKLRYARAIKSDYPQGLLRPSHRNPARGSIRKPENTRHQWNRIQRLSE